MSGNIKRCKFSDPSCFRALTVEEIAHVPCPRAPLKDKGACVGLHHRPPWSGNLVSGSHCHRNIDVMRWRIAMPAIVFLLAFFSFYFIYKSLRVIIALPPLRLRKIINLLLEFMVSIKIFKFVNHLSIRNCDDLNS